MKKPDEPLEADTWKKPKGHKNTRLWCKGKEGRYHELDFRHSRWDLQKRTCHPREQGRGFWVGEGSDEEWVCFHELYCTVCKKVMWQEFRCPDRPEGV